MKKIIFLLLPFITTLISIHVVFSQGTKPLQWFGELHTGFQSTLNDQTYSAQLKSGVEGKSYDSSEHYSAYFNNQMPVEISIGINNGKGLLLSVSSSYYQIRMSLSNPPNVVGNEAYQFGQAGMLSLKTAAYLDYSSIDAELGNKSKFHFMTGFSTGIVFPAFVDLDETTKNHFGIESFDRHVQWTAGIEMNLNIDIGKRFYIANSAGLTFPITGNLGRLQMQNSSVYIASNPVKTDELKISTGIGIHF